MTGTPPRSGPVGYRIRVAGRLDAHWAPWFGDLTLASEDGGTTSMSAVPADQAQLHRLLTKVRDLGITLVSVQAIYPPGRP